MWGSAALITVIASEAKQSRATKENWIASSQMLLAMTGEGGTPFDFKFLLWNRAGLRALMRR
jgi:hypothetical protein